MFLTDKVLANSASAESLRGGPQLAFGSVASSRPGLEPCGMEAGEVRRRSASLFSEVAAGGIRPFQWRPEATPKPRHYRCNRKDVLLVTVGVQWRQWSDSIRS